MGLRTGDRVTIDHQVFGAKVVAQSKDGKRIKVKYHCPREGQIVKCVQLNQITKG